MKSNIGNFKSLSISLDPAVPTSEPNIEQHRSSPLVRTKAHQTVQISEEIDELEETDHFEENPWGGETSNVEDCGGQILRSNSCTVKPALRNDNRGKLISPRVAGAVRIEVQQNNGVPVEKGSNSAFNHRPASLSSLNQDGKHKQKPWTGTKLTRHLSLGTAFSTMNKENVRHPTVFPGSGASLGDYSDDGHGATGIHKENYSLFRTKPGFDRQNSVSLLQGRKAEEIERESQDNTQQSANVHISAGRYFDALKGPELDVLKDYEDVLLPLDQKWPFLLRFPIGCFGICLGLGSQVILWKTLAHISWAKFLHIPAARINLGLWCLSLMALVIIFFTYSLKCIFYFEAVRREYYHPVRVNFFFAPWIVCMFLSIGVPPAIAKRISPVLWCIFMTPVFLLELKIYGQWLSGGKRRLSKVANPSSHLSIVGNFVGALLAANVNWKEPAKFFWAVGLGHYLVLFVTLYQRLPTSEALPQELHPVFFLFIAAPCTASIAWEKIYGKFDAVSRSAYFVALFLYTSLVVRVNFFRGFRFSVAWWAYTFPMTAASVATIRYSEALKHSVFIKVLAMVLSFVSSATVLTLFVTTLLHAFLWRSLFPNDLAIAITQKRNKPKALKNKDKDRKKKHNLERRTAPIRRTMEVLRSTIKKQQAKIFNRNDNSDTDSLSARIKEKQQPIHSYY